MNISTKRKQSKACSGYAGHKKGRTRGKRIHCIFLLTLLALCAGCGGARPGAPGEAAANSILAIREQGSFMVGGSVKTEPGTYNTHQPLKADGQTLHGDHAYVSYQIPVGARKNPLVFLHGAGQSAKTWESTPDGREGFSTLFLRRDFGVYLIDQPRRGRAGRSTVDETIKATADDQFWFENFRMGIWPKLYDGSQFPQSAEALDQFFRQITPNTGAYDEELIAADVAALMEKIGGGILVTHSQGGGPGWHAAIKSNKVRAIVAYEPGSGFVFPEGETPAPPAHHQSVRSFGGNIHRPGRLREAHPHPHRHLLWRLHPRPAEQQLGNGQLARTPQDGALVCRVHQPPRRRRHGGAPARTRHQGQLPLPLYREEQRAACRPALRLAEREKAGLTALAIPGPLLPPLPLTGGIADGPA